MTTEPVMKLWRVLARYPQDGGYWSEDVTAATRDDAEEAAKEIMTENIDGSDYTGEIDDGIEIVDCDEVTEAMRAKDNAVELLAAVRLYDSTYATTQTHPTPSQEAAVINAVRAVLAKIAGVTP